MKFMIFILLFLVTETLYAAPVRRLYQDIKLPTQQVHQKQTFTNVMASNASTIVNDTAGGTSAAVATLTTFTSNPDVPRVLSITPQGTTGDIESCVIVVAGTNIFDKAISDSFTFAANATGKQTGTKAFKSLTSVTFPADCESGSFAATWDIGVEESLGVERCVANKGDAQHSLLNGDLEATLPTMVVDSDEVEKNTANFNGAYNGINDFILYYIQNFGCFP